MKARRPLLLLLLASIGLAGCHKIEVGEAAGSRHGGRYQGIGIYYAGELWKQLIRNDQPNGAPGTPRVATLADDSEIIVTVDNHSGEVRQCGNFSGYCISSNPWKAPVGISPTTLIKHAADLHPNEKLVVISNETEPATGER